MPFKENSFDFILCNHVLEHINDDKKAMKELYRVLNKNGTAILQVPINQKSSKTFEDSSIVDKKERIEKFGQYDHIRLYGLDYLKKLESFGCHVEITDGHSVLNIQKKLKKLSKNKPKILIANTVKGKGISFMENNNLWHYKNPNKNQLIRALKEVNMK